MLVLNGLQYGSDCALQSGDTVPNNKSEVSGTWENVLRGALVSMFSERSTIFRDWTEENKLSGSPVSLLDENQTLLSWIVLLKMPGGSETILWDGETNRKPSEA